MMMMFTTVLVALVASCSAFHMASSSMRTMSSSLKMGDIVDICRFKTVRRLSFKTLYAAIAAAGLEETLKGEGPFTIFAPTDVAFAALPAGTLEGLLADIPKLKKILTYHVMAGKLDGETIKQMKKLPTLEGTEITVSTDGNSFFTDDAKIMTIDIDVDNGWMHAIDQIMIPGN